MKARMIVRALSAVVLSVVLAGCYSDIAAPRPETKGIKSGPPSLAIAWDDYCWYNLTTDCSDYATYDAALADPIAFGYLGGMGACYNSAINSCGGGFGTWDDGSGCIVSQTQPGCLAVMGGISSSWKNCPASITLNTTNITSGQIEYWSLTKGSEFTKLGITMGHYTGTYSSAGITTTNVTGYLVCGAGFLAATAHG